MMKLIFLHAYKHESLLQIDSMILMGMVQVLYKVFTLSLLMVMIKHSQITQSNKFAIFLQYLKKEVRNGGHSQHADKRQSFYKLVIYIQYLPYIKKNCCNCFVFYCDGKHILQGCSHERLLFNKNFLKTFLSCEFMIK